MGMPAQVQGCQFGSRPSTQWAGAPCSPRVHSRQAQGGRRRGERSWMIAAHCCVWAPWDAGLGLVACLLAAGRLEEAAAQLAGSPGTAGLAGGSSAGGVRQQLQVDYFTAMLTWHQGRCGPAPDQGSATTAAWHADTAQHDGASEQQQCMWPGPHNPPPQPTHIHTLVCPLVSPP